MKSLNYHWYKNVHQIETTHFLHFENNEGRYFMMSQNSPTNTKNHCLLHPVLYLTLLEFLTTFFCDHCIPCIYWTIFFLPENTQLLRICEKVCFEVDFARMHVSFCELIINCSLKQAYPHIMVEVCISPVGSSTEDLVSHSLLFGRGGNWELEEISLQRGNFEGSRWSPPLPIFGCTDQHNLLFLLFLLSCISQLPGCFVSPYTKNQYCHGLWIDISKV